MKKMTLKKRAEIAKSLFDLAVNHTESLSSSLLVCNDEKTVFDGKASIGEDLAYLMGAILKESYFLAISGTNALPYWLKSEYPEHEVLNYIQFED